MQSSYTSIVILFGVPDITSKLLALEDPQIVRANTLLRSLFRFNRVSFSLSLSLFLVEFDNLLFLHIRAFTCVDVSPKRKLEEKRMWPLFSLSEIAIRVWSGTMPPAKVMIESVRVVHLLAIYQP